MMKQSMILFLGIFLVCTLQSVYSADIIKEYNITESNLPFFGQESFLFQLQANETLFFNASNITNPLITLTYPSNFTFGANDTNYTLNVGYNVPTFSITQNTTITESFVVSNSLNNITSEILFNVNVADEVFNQTTIINDSQTFEVAITDDGYNITVSSNTLPKVGSLDFHLTGFPNAQGTVTFCGQFLSCPTSFTFDNNGDATIQILYNLPIGQAVGTYTRVFAIQTNGTFKQGTVIFNIISPQYIIEHYVYTDDCFLNKQTMIDCVREQQEFSAKQLSDFINALEEEDTSICPVLNETIKYVMQGEINNELKLLYDNAIRDLNASRGDNLVCSQELKDIRIENSALITQKDIIQTDSNMLVKQAQDGAFETKILSEQSEQETKKEYDDKWSFWGWLITISIVISGVVGYIIYKHKKQNWW